MPFLVDVLVIGGGHAGLTAAISAAEQGSSVCILEVAPKAMRGGNSRHTRNLRPMHERPAEPMAGVYSYDEYMDDLLRVTDGNTDSKLAELTLRESETAVSWLQKHGVAFQSPLGGTLHLGRTNAFFMGGGKALINALFRSAESLGIRVIYSTKDVQVRVVDGCFQSADYLLNGESKTIEARVLIAASGGFEANLEWLTEAWGAAASNFLVRGTPYNRGSILKQLLAADVSQVGDAKQCHAVAVDGRAPKFDGGICSRVDCVSLGIVVNRGAERFYDEGEDFWPKRYAIWGRLVAAQPGQLAFSIIDSQSEGLFMPTVFPPEQADSVEKLAETLNLNSDRLKKTIDDFNGTVQESDFDHRILDGCKTQGLDIEKSHWARRIDKPPFRAYMLRPGITFTYLGVEVNEQARVFMSDGRLSKNIYAAGEIMAGNVLGTGYLAGIGLTIGSVFGRIAGKEAGKYVSS